MPQGKVIDIREVVKIAIARQSSSIDEERALLELEDCGNGYAYLVAGYRLPWEEAIVILERYYGKEE